MGGGLIINRIDIGSLTGAKNLYTIARQVPEPASALLVLAVLASLGFATSHVGSALPAYDRSLADQHYYARGGFNTRQQ
jgi:hypothetical protein